MKQYILSLDEGTTSARALLFDRNANAVACAQHEFTQIYPQPGWVEHDPNEILSAQLAAVRDALSSIGADPGEIAAVGITNQRETVVVWDKNTGEPLCNAIVWQCRRTADFCESLKSLGKEDLIRSKTGLKLDAYFSASKLHWILTNVPGARAKAEAGELLFGTVDTWLLWKLSDGKLHITDRTNASRTLLYNIHTLEWDADLLTLFDIPERMLPTVRSSSEIYGNVNICGVPVPAGGIAGDQQAALFGQGCFTAGEMKNTYGTGCFLLMNAGETATQSQNGLLTTIAATAAKEPVQYALEGSVFVGGAVIQWLRDELRLIEKAADSEKAARRVEDNGGVYIVPAFAGLGAPYWDMYARGTVCGLTRGSGRDHLIRAALESIAYQTNDLLAAMRSDTGLTLSSLKVDGGAAANAFLMQFQADISRLAVIRPDSVEATATGAAFLAGLAAGFWKDREELRALQKGSTVFAPLLDGEKANALTEGWKRSVKSASAFSQ